MRHRKVEVADRVEDIVNRLANQIWTRTVVDSGFTIVPCPFQIWVDCYSQVLKEFFEGGCIEVSIESKEACLKETSPVESC